jgi:hypothetical protein
LLWILCGTAGGAVAGTFDGGGPAVLAAETPPRAGAAPDTVRPAKPGESKAGHFSKPRWVMLRSMVVPGWGQVYNHQWFKAGAIVAAEGSMIWRVIDDQQTLAALSKNVDLAREIGDSDLEEAAVTAYNNQLDSASTRQWLLALMITYSMVDAYVDAHFRNFKIEFERDPALPDGDASQGIGVRAGWEWGF